MKLYRKLLLGMGTAVLAMAFVLPAAAQADPFWNGGQGYVTGKAGLGFSSGGGSISCENNSVGSVIENGEESARAYIADFEMPDPNCGVSPWCWAEEATAEDLPWEVTYTGGGGSPVMATVHDMKLHLTMSQGCQGSTGLDVVIAGTVTGEQTYNAELQRSSITFSSASGMYLGKVGGFPVKTNGNITFETSSYVE